jgi:hypothetical protein
MPNHKDKPLVNAKKNMHSTLTLVSVGLANLTGWKVKGNQIKDKSNMVQGVWNAKRSGTGDQAKELRLLLKCTTTPQTRAKTVDPPSGTVTITLEKTGSTDHTFDQEVDYANDDDA